MIARKPQCDGEGCTSPATWTTETDAKFCGACVAAFLMTEDRDDFAAEYAREHRREKAVGT
jgi:hypothetical protein